MFACVEEGQNILQNKISFFMFLLAEAGSLAEKIPRLEYYSSGGIILAQGLDFQTARGKQSVWWSQGGRKPQNLAESYRSSSSQNFRKPLAWFYCQFEDR